VVRHDFERFLQQDINDKPLKFALSMSGKHSKDSFGTFRVVGEVTDRCQDVATYVKVSGVYYDKDHKVVSTSFTYTNPLDIQPGKKSPFDLTTYSNSAKIKVISLNVESNEFAMLVSPANPPACNF
jgi:hypothetical protein